MAFSSTTLTTLITAVMFIITKRAFSINLFHNIKFYGSVMTLP